MKKIVFLFLILLALPNVSFGQTSQNCLDLTTNIRQGQRDSNSKNEIISLQRFLKSEGYLSANATGFFGLQTLKAVKSLQKANNISQTGFVGPLTRLLIKTSTCTPVKQEPLTPDNVSVPEVVTITTIQEVPVLVDQIISSGSTSSLRVKTSGVVSLGKDSASLMGQITAGARSATLGFFEVTTNPSVYKTSETIISSKVSQRSNDKFQVSLNNLKPETVYYFRACAENISLGQKSCGGTSSFTTTK